MNRFRRLYDWLDDHVALLGLAMTAIVIAFALNVTSQRGRDNKAAIARAAVETAQHEYNDCLGRQKSRDALRAVIIELTATPLGEARQAQWKAILDRYPAVTCEIPPILSGSTTTAPANPSNTTTTGAP